MSLQLSMVLQDSGAGDGFYRQNDLIDFSNYRIVALVLCTVPAPTAAVLWVNPKSVGENHYWIVALVLCPLVYVAFHRRFFSKRRFK